MSEWKVRPAEPADAEAFARWVTENPQIEATDVESTFKKNNPTTVVFVVEEDGKPVAFAPMYAQMVLAHLGFNPESSGKDRLRALEMLFDTAIAFAVQFGIREISTLTKEEYPLGQVAKHFGFVPDPRQLFKFNINSILKQAEPEEPEIVKV